MPSHHDAHLRVPFTGHQGLLISVLLFVAPGVILYPAAAAQDPVAPAPAATAASPRHPGDFSDKAMAARLAMLRPDLEAALGEPLGGDIAVRAVHRDDLLAVITEENTIMEAGMGDSRTLTRLRKTVVMQARMLVDGLLGKVELATGTVVIRPDTFELAAALSADDAFWQSQDVLDLVLAHEAAHVHQARRHHLLRLFAQAANAAEFRCAMACSEGHAEWVTRRFAERRSLLPAYESYRRFYTEGPDNENPLERIVGEIFRPILAFPYVKGAEFYSAVVARLGAEEGERRVFESPPLDLDLVLHPETYLESGARPATVSPEPNSEVVVHGTLDLGRDRPPPKSFRLHLWTGAPDHRVMEVEGQNGQFEVRLPAGVACRVGLVLGEPGTCDDLLGTMLEPAPDGTVVLRIGAPPPVRVVVKDDASGAPLPGARVWPERGPRFEWPRDDAAPEPLVLPSAKTLARPAGVTSDDGRVRLDRADDFDALYAVAEGHAWSRVAIAKDEGDEVVVKLRAGGTLELRIDAWKQLLEPRVGLQYLGRRPDGAYELQAPTDLPQPSADGTLIVPGLPVGIYVVTVRRGRASGRGPIYGSQPLEIRAAATTPLHLTTASGPAAVALGFTLSASKAWGALSRVDAFLISTASDRREEPLTTIVKWDASTRQGTFSFPKVLPGEYGLFVDTYGWSEKVVLPCETPILEFALPEPIEVCITAVDGESGRPISSGSVQWTATAGGSQRPGRYPSLFGKPTRRIDARTGEARFLAAPGSVCVTCVARGYVEQTVILEVAPDSPVAKTLHLSPAGSVRVTVRVDASPSEEASWVSLQRKDDTRDSGASAWTSNGSCRFPAVAPGTYVLRVNTGEGFKPVESREIEVKVRDTTEVVIDLER